VGHLLLGEQGRPDAQQHCEEEGQDDEERGELVG